MKTNVISAAVLASVFSFSVCAQIVGNNNAAGLDMQTVSGGFVTQLPQAPPEVKGSYYLTDEWRRGTIYVQDMALKDYYFKYDIRHNQFEIKTGNEIKILSGQRVLKFEQDDNTNAGVQLFVNAKPYKLEGSPVNGFFQLIVEGEWDLLSKTEVTLVQGGYVAALDAGERDARITRTEKYYLADSDGNLILAQTIKKKNIPEIFHNESQEVQQQLVAANLNSKKLLDLTNMVSILNTGTVKQ